MKESASIILSLISIINLLHYGACDNIKKYEKELQKSKLPDYVAPVVYANYEFAKHIDNEIRAVENSSFAVCPFCISVGLSALATAAKGHTGMEIHEALGMDELSNAVIQDGFEYLINELERDNDTKIQIINNFIISNGYQLEQMYLKTLDKKFHGVATSVNFSQGIGTINKAMRSQLDIDSFLSDSELDLNDESKLHLLSTMVFSAKWERSFTSLMTRRHPFFDADGKQSEVEMMVRSDYYSYGEVPELNSTVLSLPFKGKRFSFNVILPARGISLSDVENNLNNFHFGQTMSRLRLTYMQVSIPKCTLESSIELTESGILETIGIKLVDKDESDLSKMSPRNNLKLGSYVHKVSLELTEGGSSAPAESFVESVPATFRYLGSFTVDRPFVGFIFDSVTKSIVLSARKLH